MNPTSLETLKQHVELRAMTVTARFEWWAEQFYRETGFIAPGKSVPLEMGATQDEALRQEAWDEFIAGTSKQLGDALAEAIRAIEEREELLSAIRAFMAKWQEVEPHINDVFGLQFVRTGTQYSGPNIMAELDAFAAILDRASK